MTPFPFPPIHRALNASGDESMREVIALCVVTAKGLALHMFARVKPLALRDAWCPVLKVVSASVPETTAAEHVPTGHLSQPHH